MRMMRFLFLPAFALVFTVGGCTPFLDTQKSSAPAASVVGVPSTQIRFMGYCVFGDVPPGGKHIESNSDTGLIVLTNDSIFLLAGDLSNATVRRRIKYKEIDGVDARHFLRACQLQIVRGDIVTVMEITKNKALLDQAGTDRAAAILREHGVPAWKSLRYYQPKIPPPNIIFVPI